MAILLIIIAIILFFIARALYKLADSKQERSSKARPSTSGSPLYQSLSSNEKLNIMCLLFFFAGFAKTQEEFYKVRHIVSNTADEMQIDLEGVTNYLLSRGESEKDSLLPSAINVISSISDMRVKEKTLLISFKICSCIQSTNVTSELLSVANQLGFSKHELLSLITK